MTYLAAIAGATGYAGGEVARLLLSHPQVRLATVCAHTSTGTLGEYQPHLLPLADMPLYPLDAERLAQHDVVFLGLPHGASAQLARDIERINPDVLLIDLGADHRLIDPADWAAYYDGPAAEPWVYGMPELIRSEGPSQRELLGQARRIAAPGCNATAITLAALPAISSGIAVGNDVVAALCVGYSGAGKTPKPHLLAAEAAECARPYSVAGAHRHIPEIQQNFRIAGALDPMLSMTPILAPMSRGILATVSIPLAKMTTAASVLQVYRAALAEEPFWHWSDSWPTTAMVRGSNTAYIHAELDRDGRRITAICAIDNLVKGTAGAAIQSMNLALGYAETTGLSTVGVAP
ncbi:N-acetyl-gamma-glutamyl-phosphate reductase [Trueperella sp. LYQ141]|uniref:N-acetyl-gamma-glutamyl-phosphate reductase n=1 Tax=Trueperella sp. LYQ141 TaxID=3391058 RepID=UPI0039834855